MKSIFYHGKSHLTCGKALRILSGNLSADINSDTREKIVESAERVSTIAEGSSSVYGINTGFGALCTVKISKEETQELQRKILLSHSVGVGKPIEKRIAKLMLILKLHVLAKGFSGITWEVIQRIKWHIENDVIPVVPEQGSVGASGDLAPLAHLFLPLIGEGKVMVKEEVLPTIRVLNNYGLKPLTLKTKEGLALINGTQFMAAHGLILLDEWYNNLSHADINASLMLEALSGSKMPFHANLHKLRPHTGALHVAGRVEGFLKNSEVNRSHTNCDKVQDPYSLRCVPQVHGASRQAWLHLKEVLETEINSVTDNPIIFPDGLTISGGNFHGQPIALPMDYACFAIAELGNISDRRTYLSLEEKNETAHPFLMKGTGLNSGFMISQYASAALVSENKTMCFPSSADSIPTSSGKEDHVSMGAFSARKAVRVNQNLTKILAIELMCACQALDFVRPLRSGIILEEIHGFFRSKIPHATEDKIFSSDIETSVNIINDREILSIVEKYKHLIPDTHDRLFEIY